MNTVQTLVFYLYITVSGGVEFVVEGGQFDNKEVCEAIGVSIASSMRKEITAESVDGGSEITVKSHCSEKPMNAI